MAVGHITKVAGFKFKLLRFSVDGKHFENGAFFENNVVTLIMYM